MRRSISKSYDVELIGITWARRPCRPRKFKYTVFAPDQKEALQIAEDYAEALHGKFKDYKKFRIEQNKD